MNCFWEFPPTFNLTLHQESIDISFFLYQVSCLIVVPQFQQSGVMVARVPWTVKWPGSGPGWLGGTEVVFQMFPGRKLCVWLGWRPETNREPLAGARLSTLPRLVESGHTRCFRINVGCTVHDPVSRLRQEKDSDSREKSLELVNFRKLLQCDISHIIYIFFGKSTDNWGTHQSTLVALLCSGSTSKTIHQINQHLNGLSTTDFQSSHKGCPTLGHQEQNFFHVRSLPAPTVGTLVYI